MKVLLIGPYPPPHGGISVHVARVHELLQRYGIACRVLNLDRSAPESDRYIRVSSSLDFLTVLLGHVRKGWTPHLHTNGHNIKSWLIAFICGAAGRWRTGALLTVHSGMAPAYIAASPAWRRGLLRLSCSLYAHIVCVSSQIEESIASLGLGRERLGVLPAFLQIVPPKPVRSANFERWIQEHKPLLSTTLFFRPEYGFELLVKALAQLRRRFPRIGCLVMGIGEQESGAHALVRRERLEDAVLLLGDVTHETCLGLMSLSDLFARPTLKDGDSVSVREAISLGIPVVASSAGTRPPEALIFEAGNPDDLSAKIESCLKCARFRPRHNTRVPDPNRQVIDESTSSLLEMYQNAALGKVKRVMRRECTWCG